MKYFENLNVFDDSISDNIVLPIKYYTMILSSL